MDKESINCKIVFFYLHLALMENSILGLGEKGKEVEEES